jgi:uncharacterized protein YjbI with pentapeptide repeats
MLPMADLQSVPPSLILERLSTGKRTQSMHVTGSLDVDPLVVSRWLCGEDMRGVYQPIILRDCILDELNLDGCTFYEVVRLTDCRIATARFAQAYFYTTLLIENCIFEETFEGQYLQSDGGIVVHNTVFTGWANFSGVSLRGELDFVGVSFPGGTDLLYILTENLTEHRIRFSGCRFRAADIPAGLDLDQSGITPLVEDNPRSTKG